MKQKRDLPRIFFPGLSTLITLTCLAAATPLLVLAQVRLGFFLPYAAYLLALYVLVVMFLRLPFLFQNHRKMAEKNPLHWFSGVAARAKIGLLLGSLANLIYAAFRLVAGAVYRSFWFAAEAIYYIILSLTRYLVASKEQEGAGIQDHAKRLSAEWQAYRLAAKLLFLLDASLGGIVLSVLLQKQEKEFPAYLLLLSAAYTLYCVTVSVYQIFRFRAKQRPALLSAKALSLCASFLSLFTLQVTLLSRFCTWAITPFLHAFAGSASFLGVLSVAVYMLRKSAHPTNETIVS